LIQPGPLQEEFHEEDQFARTLSAYDAPGHFGMTAMRLQGTEETGASKFWMGLSHFLPGGGADWGYEDNPAGKGLFRFGGGSHREEQG
jgi:hypothetical protein